MASVRDGTGRTVGRSDAGIARNANATMIVAITVRTSANTNRPDGAPRFTPCRGTTALYVWRRGASQAAFAEGSVTRFAPRDGAFGHATCRVV